ncbi:GGDEF domain-containing protein [Vibrio sp. CAU 1672]|uniref:diguanylate cyclase GefA n=1 Tax=Vibrio sp. CAU 1672 TaxID=3032594 RepID=UPI0023D99433|nr:GGDEF domain-containing protein [Vibrio sp. CAU 1672]MDF2152558.1 GGDEF domain-containing protein [Vibrio sp. CAU 1672]
MTDEFKKSTANLKKAVPLMIKNYVAATPANYALWYTYVDKTIPELNEELDTILDNYGICPPATNKKLYTSYVATKAETSLEELRNNVEVLLTEVASSMNDTLTDTSTFSAQIDKSFNKLEKVQDSSLNIEEVMSVIRQLVSESREIRHSTRFLNNQLTNASEEISRLKQQLADVQKDALFDGLSNLYNRRAFDSDLSILVNSNQALSLILLDIDYFKRFNDEYGHLFGDSVIRAIAKKLQQSCRDGISAYRFGGEEFALIVPNKSLRIARQYADSLRRMIERLRVRDKRSGEQVHNITASFGVAEFQVGENIETLIERADKQLYDAKQLGRNRVMPI